MFRAQTHQVFICLALSRLGHQGQLARQISRCFWVLDHPFEFALPHLPCTLRFGLTPVFLSPDAYLDELCCQFCFGPDSNLVLCGEKTLCRTIWNVLR